MHGRHAGATGSATSGAASSTGAAATLPASRPGAVRRRQGVPGQRPGLGRVGRRRQQLEGRHHEEPLADRSSRPRSRRGTIRSTSARRSSIVRCAGEPGEGIGMQPHPRQRAARLPLDVGNNTSRTSGSPSYALLDGTFGHYINNQGEGWGLLDFSSSYFDQGEQTVETAKPVGYGWRVGGSRGQPAHGGFYDILGPNNYNVEKGSYAKIREVSLTYRVGRVRGIGGDWTVGLVGRNLYTFTNYTRLRSGSRRATAAQRGLGLINQTDAFGYPDAPHVHVHSLHALLGASRHDSQTHSDSPRCAAAVSASARVATTRWSTEPELRRHEARARHAGRRREPARHLLQAVALGRVRQHRPTSRAWPTSCRSMNYSSLANNCQNSHFPFSGARQPTRRQRLRRRAVAAVHHPWTKSIASRRASSRAWRAVLTLGTPVAHNRDKAFAEFLRGVARSATSALIYDSLGVVLRWHGPRTPGKLIGYKARWTRRYAAFQNARSTSRTRRARSPTASRFPRRGFRRRRPARRRSSSS